MVQSSALSAGLRFSKALSGAALENIGVIFDFNGTLIFDGKLHDRAWRTFTQELILKEVSDIEADAFIAGRSPKEILEHFIGYDLSDNMISQFSDEKERVYRSLLSKEDPGLAPGAEEFLTFLRLTRVPMAIASCANLENMNFYYERYGLERWIKWENAVIASPGLPAKPHPDLYLAALGKLGIPAEKVVAFEDSKSGIDAAYEAGIRHIVLITGDSWNENLKSMPGVIAAVRDFTELNADNFA